jgi:hypothetical protein
MHKKRNTFKKWLAGLAMFGLVASGAVAFVSAANANPIDVPAGGLNFEAEGDLEGFSLNQSYTYENIDGQGTDAVVSVTELVNSRSSSMTSDTWTLNWSELDWGVFGVPAEATYLRVQWIDFSPTDLIPAEQANEFFYPALGQPGLSLDTDSLNNVVPVSSNNADPVDPTFIMIDYVVVNISAFNAGGALVGAAQLDVTRAPLRVDHTSDAGFTYADSKLRYLDDEDSDSNVINGFIETRLSAKSRGVSSATIQISFENNGAPVTYTSLRLSTYDLDQNQFVEFFGVSRSDITEGSNIASVTTLSSPAGFRVTALDSETDAVGEGDSQFTNPLSTSYTDGRVDVNYLNVSEIVIVFGMAVTSSSASFQFDLGGRVDAAIAEINEQQGTGGSYQSAAVTKSNRAVLIAGGFEHNSRKLTPKMKRKIDRWLAKHPDLKTVTCTGFTSLPRRTSDVKLSTNRGKTACNYAKSERPELTTSASKGKEDPRPGSNVRRVRFVLTP